MEAEEVEVHSDVAVRPEKRLKYRERNHNSRINKKKRKLAQEMTEVLMPDSFDGNDLCDILNYLHSAREESKSDLARPFKYFQVFPFCCGLLIKLRSGLNRLYRKSQYRFPRRPEEQADQFIQLVTFMVQEGEEHQLRLNQYFPRETLWLIAEELSAKSVNLNNDLQKEFLELPLYPLDTSSQQLQFPEDFLSRVESYHLSLQRPEGTFDLPESERERLSQLAALPRQKCLHCNCTRQIYCGPCGGIPVESAKPLLPPPITLPFDVLLLLHYQESLVKCTGIHVACLCQPNTLSYWNWEKPSEEWQVLVEKLDPARDILLFPYPNSIPAESFPWHALSAINSESNPNESNNDNGLQSLPASQRYRLVVLEASWGYGKTMAQQILDHRQAKQLPPLRSVILTNVVGEYWRFQAEGQSAVSTIEAITYAATAAGLSEREKSNLLLLFRLQKYRVLQNTEQGGKIPRAVEVAGVGLGSWKNVSIYNAGKDDS